MEPIDSHHELTGSGLQLLLQPLHLITDSATASLQQCLQEVVDTLQADYARVVLPTGKSAPVWHYCGYARGALVTVDENCWVEDRVIAQGTGFSVTSPSPLPYFCDALELKAVTQIIAVPVLIDEKVLGVLSIGFTQSRPYSESDMTVLQSFSDAMSHLVPQAMPLAPTKKYLVDFADLNSPLPWPLMLISDTGTILHVNRVCADLICREADALCGVPISSLMSVNDLSFHRTNSTVVDIPQADGTCLPLKIFAIPITLDDGGRIVLLGLYDFTKEQESLESRLRSAELAGITHTVATLNHGINNPLFGLMATIQLLRHELEAAPPTVQKKLDRIVECCERIRVTTEQLADIKRLTRRIYAAEESMLDLSCSVEAMCDSKLSSMPEGSVEQQSLEELCQTAVLK